MSSVESSRWLLADDETDVEVAAGAEGVAETDVIDATVAGDNDDSCRVMADTIRLLLLPRTRLFRAASLAGDNHSAIDLDVFFLRFTLCLTLFCSSSRSAQGLDGRGRGSRRAIVPNHGRRCRGQICDEYRRVCKCSCFAENDACHRSVSRDLQCFCQFVTCEARLVTCATFRQRPSQGC